MRTSGFLSQDEGGARTLAEFPDHRRRSPDQHCRCLCGIVHRFKPNHLRLRPAQFGKQKEIPVRGNDRLAMLLCEIMDDFVLRFAIQAELPYVGALEQVCYARHNPVRKIVVKQ